MITYRPLINLFRMSRLQPVAAALVFAAFSLSANAQTPGATRSGCHVQETDYKGWHGQQISNDWLQLVIVPQNGGRLIQVTFGGHPYLFVNPKLAGKYFPPANDQWFNYGGDKLWLLPEGNNDEQHWVGNSDVIDDSPFTFRKVSEGKQCEIELTGPADPQTGIQFVRTISIAADSPNIHFHATMKNITGHTVDWSMQSVSQYNTSILSSDGGASSQMNRDFWTFTPANPASTYLNRYHVRYGPAENRGVSVRDDGLFAVHYAHQAAELWLDSTAGWLAVVDASTHYAMVERFQYETSRPYPGKASVIFWTNGLEAHLKDDGELSLGADPDASPYYLEAELNSPMCHLRPAESCTFDTEWFPTRAGSEFHGATEPGILIQPLKASRTPNGKIALSGSFGVFFAGHLVAHWYDHRGAATGTSSVADVTPTEAATIQTEITPPGKAARLSLHLVDNGGLDRGALQELFVDNGENR
ncbi:MAG TPA: hypothetical protein VGS27_09565 [Candidatus Sulfotelmatobacter sp.]|nr:hypothetical protein [Candidatus Sulfotelmatobacter sp.]